MNKESLEKMNKLKLYGMHQSFQTLVESKQHMKIDHDELVSILVQAEWEDRENRKISRYLRTARFRYNASLENVEFTSDRNLDKSQFLRLADCSFISRKENILVTGSTGVGKSYIASVLGHQACLNGHRCLYFNSRKLFARLKISKADGSYIKQINRIEKQDLLVIDDFGLQPLDTQERLMLLEIIEDRHERRSTIISSQLPVTSWYEIIGDNTIADAILDRLAYSSHRLELKGPSMRGKNKVKN